MISLQERSLVGSSLAKLVVPGCFCRDDRACPKTKSTHRYNDNAKESKPQDQWQSDRTEVLGKGLRKGSKRLFGKRVPKKCLWCNPAEPQYLAVVVVVQIVVVGGAVVVGVAVVLVVVVVVGVVVVVVGSR